MEGIGKKCSFAKSCAHRKDCCPLFSLSSCLCSPSSHFTLLQWTWHWLQESIQLNCQTLQLILSDYFFLPGWWFQVAWTSMKFEAENKQTKPTNTQKGKNPGILTTWREVKKQIRNQDFQKQNSTSARSPCDTNLNLGLPDTKTKEGKRTQEHVHRIRTANHSKLRLEILDAKHIPKCLYIFLLKYEVKHHLWCLQRFGTIEVPLQQCPNMKSFLWWFSTPWGLARLSPQSNKCAETHY